MTPLQMSLWFGALKIHICDYISKGLGEREGGHVFFWKLTGAYKTREQDIKFLLTYYIFLLTEVLQPAQPSHS
jgi:hypothetical protein